MSEAAMLKGRLRLPVIGAPLFIISNPDLVIAQCKAGVVGSFPALNARPQSQLDEWLDQITSELDSYNTANPDNPAAPYAVNQIVHRSNDRLEAGLIAVCAGAGGHAGVKSPFALVQEIREFFDGPLALSGSIATGDAVLAAQAMGADYGYIGSPFIATAEARASDDYKQGIVEGTSDDIVYSSLFTGVHGNYLKASIRNAGLDPDDLPESDPSAMNFGGGAAKAWKDIWGSGQGIGAITSVLPAGEYIDRLKAEYDAAKARLCG